MGFHIIEINIFKWHKGLIIPGILKKMQRSLAKYIKGMLFLDEDGL